MKRLMMRICTPKNILNFLLMLVAFSVAHLFFYQIDEARETSDTYLGRKVVMPCHTSTIVSYDWLAGKYTLSNGLKVDAELIDQFIINN